MAKERGSRDEVEVSPKIKVGKKRGKVTVSLGVSVKRRRKKQTRK